MHPLSKSQKALRRLRAAPRRRRQNGPRATFWQSCRSAAFAMQLRRRQSPTPAIFAEPCEMGGDAHLFEGSLSVQGPLMRLLIAIFLPWLLFFTIGRPFAGIICLILQITLIGWIPAALWAVYALSQYRTDEKIRALRDWR
jgi:hypothetical protein